MLFHVIHFQSCWWAHYSPHRWRRASCLLPANALPLPLLERQVPITHIFLLRPSCTLLSWLCCLGLRACLGLLFLGLSTCLQVGLLLLLLLLLPSCTLLSWLGWVGALVALAACDAITVGYVVVELHLFLGCFGQSHLAGLAAACGVLAALRCGSGDGRNRQRLQLLQMGVVVEPQLSGHPHVQVCQSGSDGRGGACPLQGAMQINNTGCKLHVPGRHDGDVRSVKQRLEH